MKKFFVVMLLVATNALAASGGGGSGDIGTAQVPCGKNENCQQTKEALVQLLTLPYEFGLGKALLASALINRPEGYHAVITNNDYGIINSKGYREIALTANVDGVKDAEFLIHVVYGDNNKIEDLVFIRRPVPGHEAEEPVF